VRQQRSRAPTPVSSALLYGYRVHDLDPDAAARALSYSYRKPETPGQVVWNRISVTASRFATALGAAILLGRKR
jgi:hypothetical protein